MVLRIAVRWASGIRGASLDVMWVWGSLWKVVEELIMGFQIEVRPWRGRRESVVPPVVIRAVR